MKSYIVWFDELYEAAEEAAAAINGQTIPLKHGRSKEQAVTDLLRLFDYSPSAVAMLEAVDEFIADHNLYGRSANRSENCYNCVVFLEDTITAEQWLDFFNADDFNSKVTPDEAATVFTNILHGSSDINYHLLDQLLRNYACDEAELDFVLIPNRPDLAGFDDLSYLLRSVSWTTDNYRLHLERLCRTDLLWLYKRNLTTINQWMAEQNVDLLNTVEMLYPEVEDKLVEAETICASLVLNWTYNLMYRYTQLIQPKAQAV